MSESARPVSSAVDEFRRGAWVLAGCFLGIAISAPSIAGYLGGIFVEPLEDEFGWSRSAISLQTLFTAGLLALTAPMAGRLIDRFGVRPVALLSFLLFGLSQFALSRLTESLLLFYGLSMLITFVAAGTTAVVFTKIVNSWFDRARGLALGITLLGSGVTAMIGPVLLTSYVDSDGWRAGYRALGWVILAGAVLVWLLIRDRPAGVGGGDGAPEAGQAEAEARIDGLPVREALRSPEFMLICAAFLLVSLSIGGVLLHFIPMMGEYGMTREQAAGTFSFLGAAVLLGRIGTGILIDRFFAPRVAMIMVLVASLGYLALLLGGAELAFLTALAVGFSVGAEIDLIGYLAARYFGLKNYGVIYGVIFGVTIFGLGLAPFLTGLAYDAFGNYDGAIAASGVGLALSAGLFFIMRPFPERPAAASGGVQDAD